MPLLTDVKARSVIPGSRAVPHGAVTGLSLLPSATLKGQGKWVFRYVSPTTGSRRNAGLGSYPQISIAAAGKLAREMREQIANGQDPLTLKAAEAAKLKIPTFQEAATQVHTEMKPGWRNEKHAQQWINTLVEYV
ncbi:TPA: Arm DNA-binding domain-containing protein, partial [Stenotrophomonas maltophilia]